MADDLHGRYMAAGAAYRGHRAVCAQCAARRAAPAHSCATGQRLYETFARLQDAYLNRQQHR